MRAYRLTVLAALLPTVAAGWLYIRAQLQMGVELDPARLDRASLVLWYVLTPWIAAFVEETVWRGYAIPRLRGAWRSVLLAGLSFAFFHGIFPLVFAATLLQGLVWGWVYRRTESTLPGMALHVMCRYLALIPGLV
jgi:membrane protease YdiL (CAAX protease family)